MTLYDKHNSFRGSGTWENGANAGGELKSHELKSPIYSEHRTIYAPNKDPANLSFMMGRHATFGFHVYILHAWRATTTGI